MFKVGDRVRIIGVSIWGGNHYIGYEGVINDADHSDGAILVQGIKMKTGYKEVWFHESSLELIPEPKFKEGDRVVVGKNEYVCPTGEHVVGSDVAIYDSGYDSLQYWFTSGYNAMERDMTLITDTFYCCFVEDMGIYSDINETLEEAKTEAEKLAEKYCGCRVYILQAVEYCSVPDKPVEWNKIGKE